MNANDKSNGCNEPKEALTGSGLSQNAEIGVEINQLLKQIFMGPLFA